ncbi:hypothetical protein DRI96_05350 [Candidatus Aerophobetes bacterium]|uniref:Uncharacterized protein n=1 Tax=Aerophobetes bacterium TaxID=2030807 RepID=A0A662DAR4_UNCAE|nr:MAG: hypothetical protein DRI96_05350 [Candidatus Aerophobetes bacterium]
MAVDKTKLALRKKEKEVEIFRQIARVISSSLELDEVLKEIVEMAVSLTRADSCLIYLFDEVKKNLF